MPPSTLVAEFEQLPSDSELAVFFPQRALDNDARLRESNGELHIVTHGLPTVAICVIEAIVLGVVVGFGDRFPHSLDENTRAAIFFYGAMILAVTYVFGSWLNRTAASLNPIVALDRQRNELRINGRADPISAEHVVEIVVWSLTGANHKQLHLARGEAPHIRQVAMITRIGARYQLEFLFHDHATSAWFVFVEDPAAGLAKALNVPYRRLAALDDVRDLRPADRFYKRA